MRSETFTYLARKIVDEFEGCGWKDDKSTIYSTRYLGDIESSLRKMEPLEERIQRLLEEIRNQIRYY